MFIDNNIKGKKIHPPHIWIAKSKPKTQIDTPRQGCLHST